MSPVNVSSRMFTTSGAHCETYIQCEMTDTSGEDLSHQWHLCYLGDRFFIQNSKIPYILKKSQYLGCIFSVNTSLSLVTKGLVW